MHSHLIVVTFEGQDEASNVYDALERMRASPLLGLQNAAIVSRDGSGRLAVIRRRRLSQVGEDPGTYLTGSAITLLFGDPPDEWLQMLVREGFDDQYREQVVSEMAGDSSALVFPVAGDSSVDRNRLLGVLTLFKGRVFETTLPLEVEAALVKGWEA